MQLHFFENRLKKGIAPGRSKYLRRPVSCGIAALGGKGHDWVILQNNPVNFRDPSGLAGEAFVAGRVAKTISNKTIKNTCTMDSSGRRIISSGAGGMAGGAVSGAIAGSAAGGIGALPGGLAGGIVGLAGGLLRGTLIEAVGAGQSIENIVNDPAGFLRSIYSNSNNQQVEDSY